MQKKIKKYLCYGIYGIIGGVGLTILAKEAIEHLDFRIIEKLGLYREDEFFEVTADPEMIAEKLLQAIEENKNIKDEHAQILIQLKKAIMEHPYIDYSDLYQVLRTLKIKDSNEIMEYSNGSIVRASYSYTENICTLYREAGGGEIHLSHEGGHIFLGHLSDYFYLNEGITELYITEYCRNGIPDGYWVNVYCVRILCELIEPKVLLQAQSLDDSSLIIQALTEVCQDEILSKKLLDVMEIYCEKDFKTYPTKEDKELLENTIDLFLSVSNKIDQNTIERIQNDVEMIKYPHIDMREEPILYFNIGESAYNKGEILKKYFKHKECGWKIE